MSRRVVLLLVFAALFAADVWHYREHLLDDAFISFRYARNAAMGDGVVFNRGERVEGYTNPSWVALAAAALHVGLDPVAVARGVALAAALFTLFLTARLERRRRADPDGIPVAVLLLLGAESFAYWSVATLETSLFTALVLAGVAAATREWETGRWGGSGLVFALAALTRPEGALFFATAWLSRAFATARLSRAAPDRTRDARRVLAANAAVFATVFCAHLAWRFAYYGALVPNTFTAKVTGDLAAIRSGLDAAAQWGLAFPVLGVALVAGAFLGRNRSSPRDPLLVLCATLCVVYTLYVVAVGGDFMPFQRLWLPILPLLCLLVALGPVRDRLTARPAWLVAGLAAHALVVHAGDGRYRAFFAHRSTQWGLEVGRMLDEHLPPDAVIAVNTAGAIPYVSGRTAIDMLGLTDRAIARRDVYVVSPGYGAHRRGHGAYVLERRPQAILWYNTTGAFDPVYLGDRELAADPVFRFFYRPRSQTLRRDDADGRILERLLGDPLAIAPRLGARLPGLGIEVSRAGGLAPHTTVRGAPAIVRWFELESRDVGLWDERAGLGADPAAFVARAAAHWRDARPEVAASAAERAAVETLCADAAARLDAGNTAPARALLERAHAANARAQAPCVYRLIARSAREQGELWSAIAAQKEALRMAPGDGHAAEALVHLLTAPVPGAPR